MRIVFVDTTTDSEMIGGGHLILPSLMGALKKRGHEVHLVTKGIASPQLQPFIELSGAIVHINPWKKKAPIELISPIFNMFLKRINPDVYVISSSAGIGWTVLPYLDSSVPTYTIGHNNENTFYLPVIHYRTFLTGAIGVSHQICKEYISKCLMQDEAVSWIPYGVEAAKELRHSDEAAIMKMIYVGRIEETQKRVPDLVKVANELFRKNIRFKLTIVGDGPYMPELKRGLREEIDHGCVDIKGWLSKEDVLRELRCADVFVLTSAFEGFSIALTEAMANGCCPVVTDIPSGNQQLVKNGENGFLIEVGNIDEFVSKLSRLSEDRELLNQIRTLAWSTGAQFSLDRMAEQYEKVFQSGINKLRERPRKTDPGYPLMSSCRSSYPLFLRVIKSKLSKRQTI